MPLATSRLRDVANGGLRASAVCVAFCIALQSVALQPRTLATEPSLASANAQAISAGDTVPKFELDVLPILTATGCNSGACHGKARGQNGFALSLLGFDPDFDYEALVNQARGRRLFPAAPTQSLLLMKGAALVPHGGGVRLTLGGDDYNVMLRWISAGAPRVNENDPKLQRIAITPEPHPLQGGARESLQVTAYYSDGSQRNVTTTCAYQSNEPAIVSVDRAGNLQAGDLPGEATIMARYMGHIATWNTAIPRPEAVSDDTYERLPRNNAIDEHVFAKLRQLNVLPSDTVGDSSFIRRVFLDVIGRLPSHEETTAFLSDSADDKRERLIDWLLEQPEYADFWANKWADLLRPNPYRVGIKATMSLDGWLRDAFRENLPYDEFARQLIMAQGSTWRNGAVTIFRDRRSPDEITTLISQMFLGVRLECAKCHQHPFETYGQREFYSLAAYFGRVGYKGTGLSPPISGGEEVIMLSDKGEVRHPLTSELLVPSPLFGTYRAVAPEEDPRAVFAEWLTSPENPNFAKVAANRIWGELFGVGIVDPVDDFRATNPPSNPELLDALADEFMRLGFDQKQFIKFILQSRTYALASAPNETNAGDHRNFSRHYRKRMRAEVLADAIADVTGVRERYEGMPPDARAVQLWTHRAQSDFLDAFGRPDPNQDPPCERTPDATMVQALHLMNAPALHRQVTSDESRMAELAKSETPIAEVIDKLYLTMLSRRASEEEQAALQLDFAKPGTVRRAWIEDLTWSLLNTPEFVYED